MQFRYYLGISTAIVVGILVAIALMEGVSRMQYIATHYIDFPWSKDMGAEQGVYQYEDGIASTNYSEIDASIDVPKVTSKSYLVADLDTGEVIAANDPHDIYAIASISKLMTALVAIETIDPYAQITVTRTAIGTLGEQGHLQPGEILTANELLYPLLLESSNDAAEALAAYAGREDFIKNMNNKAMSLGLSGTSFDDPSGLSPRNRSTAFDLFTLVQYIDDTYPEILAITDKKSQRMKGHTWYNNNKFINDRLYTGGKNGYTSEAKHTLLTTFRLPLSEAGDRRIAIVLLQAEKTEKDTRDILFYLLRNILYHG